MFTAQFLDLFINYMSVYNTCMKVVSIAGSFSMVWMIYSKFKATYDGNQDTFWVEFLVPMAVLAFLVKPRLHPSGDPLYLFHLPVALLPQLCMVSKSGQAETITPCWLWAFTAPSISSTGSSATTWRAFWISWPHAWPGPDSSHL